MLGLFGWVLLAVAPFSANADNCPQSYNGKQFAYVHLYSRGDILECNYKKEDGTKLGVIFWKGGLLFG